MKNHKKNKTPVTPSKPSGCYEFITGQELAKDILEKTETVYAQKEPPPGLNLLPGCLVPGAVTVVCALTSENIRMYMASLILEAQDKLLNPAVFLPDYSVEEFALKAVCVRAGLPSFTVRRGYIAREDWPKLTKAAGELSEKEIFLYRRSIIQSRDIARETEPLQAALNKQGKSLGVVIVDSLNYVKPYEWGEITMPELRAMAKKLNVPVICSFALKSTPLIHEGLLQLGDIRLAGLDESDVDRVFYLRSPSNYGECDFAQRGEVELRRLCPAIGTSDYSRLTMDRETGLFKSDMPMPEEHACF